MEVFYLPADLFVGCELWRYSTWVTFRVKEHVGVVVSLVSTIVPKCLDVLARADLQGARRVDAKKGLMRCVAISLCDRVVKRKLESR